MPLGKKGGREEEIRRTPTDRLSRVLDDIEEEPVEAPVVMDTRVVQFSATADSAVR